MRDAGILEGDLLAVHRTQEARTGQIIVDLAPHIYDSYRMIRIIGDDGKQDTAEINKPTLRDGMEIVQNDITAGSYDVVTVAGPSYATRREESAEAMTAFMQAVPGAGAVSSFCSLTKS